MDLAERPTVADDVARKPVRAPERLVVEGDQLGLPSHPGGRLQQRVALRRPSGHLWHGPISVLGSIMDLWHDQNGVPGRQRRLLHDPTTTDSR